MTKTSSSAAHAASGRNPASNGPLATARAEGPGAAFRKYFPVRDEIEGWMHDGSVAVWDALLEFQRERRVRGPMLEIGVYHGRAAALLGLHTEPHEKLYLVDMPIREKEVEAAMAKVDLDPRVEVLTMSGDSTELHISPLVAEQFRRMRFIHVDGEHTARAVTSDMAAAAQMLSKDGILVIDDFFSSMYPQVTEAVFRHVRQFPDDFALFLVGFNKAYLARPHFVHEYLDYCATRLPEELDARDVAVTLSRTTYTSELNCYGIGLRYEGRVRRGSDWDQDAFPV